MPRTRPDARRNGQPRRAATADLQTGLAVGTRVMTLDGEIPVEFLTPGDRVITRQGVRTLKALHVTERREMRAVIIRACVLAHGRPTADVTVAPDQPIFLRDWRARALYGEDAALVPAARLADGRFIARIGPVTLRCFALIFDTPAIIYAEGVELGMEQTSDALA